MNCEEKRERKIMNLWGRFFLILIICFGISYSVFAEENNPLDSLRDFTTGMFMPVSGKVISVQEGKVTINIGAKDSMQPGMRLNVLREEAPFRHPVTKQLLGRLESLVGKVEIKEVNNDTSTAIIIQGTAGEGDKVRISEIKINLLFCQSKGIDWSLSDSYYKKLRDTGRFNMIDTDLETDETSKILEEGRKQNADVALLLTKKPGDTGGTIIQKLFYVPDGILFSEKEIVIPPSFSKELKIGENYFSFSKKEETLRIELPFNAKMLSTGDIDGDGKEEIVLITDKDIRFYSLEIDLNPIYGGLKIEGSKIEDFIWVDTIDLNNNGKAEVIVTSMAQDEIVSYIYEYSGSEFKLLYKDNIFIKKINNFLAGQAFSKTDGFGSSVFQIIWDNGYKRSSELSLPKDVNIYDFVFFDDPRLGKLTIVYDEKGHLNVYDDKAMKLWKSKSPSGGFLTTFKRSSPSIMVDKGEWAIKDRIFIRNANILSVERLPFLNMIKGLGYKRSVIKSYLWNGMSMEERVLIDNIKGTIFDYAISGDTLLVIASPMFGVKPGNILKGENPLKTELYVYSLKRI